MKEWGDCRGGRAPNIDQGASIAVRQRGACAKVERKARTRRDFSAFFARCAIAYRKFTLSDSFGSLAWALEHAASGRLGFFSRVRVRARQAVFVFCLHLFTGSAQLISTQRNKGEGFYPSTFTLRFTRERESAMSSLLLRNMHKCRPQITYSREGAGEDLGEGERPFLRKTFTPNSLTYCKM